MNTVPDNRFVPWTWRVVVCIVAVGVIANMWRMQAAARSSEKPPPDKAVPNWVPCPGSAMRPYEIELKQIDLGPNGPAAYLSVANAGSAILHISEYTLTCVVWKARFATSDGVELRFEGPCDLPDPGASPADIVTVGIGQRLLVRIDLPANVGRLVNPTRRPPNEKSAVLSYQLEGLVRLTDSTGEGAQILLMCTSGKADVFWP